MISNATINKLLDRQNRTMRAEGAVMLTQELENAEPEKFALLLPYMGSFIKFLGTLSEEASPKVSKSTQLFQPSRLSFHLSYITPLSTNQIQFPESDTPSI